MGTMIPRRIFADGEQIGTLIEELEPGERLARVNIFEDHEGNIIDGEIKYNIKFLPLPGADRYFRKTAFVLLYKKEVNNEKEDQ